MVPASSLTERLILMRQESKVVLQAVEQVMTVPTTAVVVQRDNLLVAKSTRLRLARRAASHPIKPRSKVLAII